jgi:nucleotide-binding universal stress UspA family protein
MATGGTIRHVLLEGESDEGFGQSAAFAVRLIESFGARLHVVYVVDEPLAAGFTAEVSAERLPELHQAMEAEARERLTALIPPSEQERLGVELVLRIGIPAVELQRYIKDHSIDLAIVRARVGSDADTAKALLDAGDCAVLALR